MKTTKHKIDLEKDQAKIDKRKRNSTAILYSAMVGWVIFTSTKIFDLVDMSKPPGAWWLPWVATFFISGGFIIWLLVLEYMAKTDTQRNTAGTMMGIALLAEMAMAGSDTILRQDQFDIILPPQFYWIISALPVFIVLVYTAGAAFFIWKDPDAQARLKISKATASILEARNTHLEVLARNSAEGIGQGMAQDLFTSKVKNITGVDVIIEEDSDSKK